MRALFKKLEEFLLTEYTPEEVLHQIRNARIKKVTPNKVHIVYDSGVLEVLKLKGTKLVSTRKPDDPIEYDEW